MFVKPGKTQLKVLFRLLLICAGLSITFFIIKSLYDDCAYRWIHDLNGFGRKYSSVWDCFISRSKGGILIAFLIGSLPISIGWRFFRRL